MSGKLPPLDEVHERGAATRAIRKFLADLPEDQEDFTIKQVHAAMRDIKPRYDYEQTRQAFAYMESLGELKRTGTFRGAVLFRRAGV